MEDLFAKIRAANKKRKMANFARRLLKLGEEYGEANQAFLSVTSKSNSKNKSWEDVREELVDVLIVNIDLLLHTFPGEEELNETERQALIWEMIERKLGKWDKANKKNGDTSEEA